MAAVAVLIASLTVGSAIPRPDSTFVAVIAVVLVVFLVLALATMFIAPLMVVALVAAFEPVSRALGGGFVGIEGVR